MSATAALTVLCALAYSAAVVFAVFRSTKTTLLRVLLIAGRVLLLALLASALFQPELRFTRLAPPPGPPVVLLDNSLSMRLFGMDSLWERSLSAQCRGARVYLFGDSLRTNAAEAAPEFNDLRSYFPALPAIRPLARAQRVILITDGNWSNTRTPSAQLWSKDVLYARLESATQPSWLNAQTVEQRVESTVGDTSRVRVVLTGQAPSRTTVSVTCAGMTRAVPAGPGYFRDTIEFALRPEKSATRVRRVLARMDTLESRSQFIQSVLPSTLLFASYHTTPRLDSRFLARAVRRAGGWSAADAGRRPHLLIVFDWDSGAAKAVRSIERGGLVLFAGCLPCDSVTTRAIARPAIQPTNAVQRYAGDALWPEDAAPVSALACRSQPFKRAVSLLRLRDIGRESPIDTLSACFRGTFQGYQAIALPIRGFWRWDFLSPAGTTAETPEHPFSSWVLSTARDMLVSGLSEAILVSPSRPPLTDQSDIDLHITIPPAPDIDNTVKLRMLLTGAARDTIIDTSFHAPTAQRFDLSLPRVQAGEYALYAVATQGSWKTETRDSLFVAADMSEFALSHQNESLLGQFARPVSVDSIGAALAAGRVEVTERRTETTSRRVEHSWLLLSVIFAVLAFEWILRRVRGLE